MKRATKVAALLLASLAGAGGCAQVFGLGDYGQLPADGGENGAVDATSSGDSGPGDSAPDARAQGDAAVDAGPRPDAQAADAADGGLDSPVFAADACTGATTCAPAPPSGGWTGPLVLWEGTGSAPSCAAFYYAPTFQGGTALADSGAAQCSCSCGAPSGATCGAATVQFGTGGCSSSCGSASLPLATCTSVQTLATGCGAGAQVTISGSTAAGGNCQPDAAVTLPPPAWAAQAVACAPSSTSPAGCGAGQECVPAPQTPFMHFCVSKAGVNSCVAPFTQQHLYYAALGDSRGCTACTCGGASGVDCNANGHVGTWGNPNCNASAGPSLGPLPVACTTASPHSMEFTTTPTGGSCAPSGGQPTGSLTPQTLTTVCCTP